MKLSSILQLLLAVPLCVTAAAAMNTALADGEPDLRIVATNVQSDAGKLYVWVYDRKDDWLSDRYRTQKVVTIAGNRIGDRVSVELLLPAGDYALSIFQDVDDDGKLKRNFIGIPKEPAGLSNNARPRFGPPKYQDAVFTVTPGTLVEQKIALQ